jgi:hypothetical protein
MTDGVDLYWIPLGAGSGGALVRWSGRTYEALSARRAGRRSRPLFHSALMIHLDGVATSVEVAPVWLTQGERGVVVQGAVGSELLGRCRLFRYEIRCWAGGVIPDLAAAVGGPTRLTDDSDRAARVLDAVGRVPALVWGRDELGTGDMWNSNSVVSWTLASGGVQVAGVGPPGEGRAPGWRAGLVAAARRIDG